MSQMMAVHASPNTGTLWIGIVEVPYGKYQLEGCILLSVRTSFVYVFYRNNTTPTRAFAVFSFRFYTHMYSPHL